MAFYGGGTGGPEGGDDKANMNVYDEKFDQYIEKNEEELKLTSEVEPHLGYHPYSTNYLLITLLNINYVRKNLKEAQKFLRYEEQYAMFNIYDRCFFLVSEQNEQNPAGHLIAKNRANHDSNLKMARIIFRYRYNLDELFDFKPEP